MRDTENSNTGMNHTGKATKKITAQKDENRTALSVAFEQARKNKKTNGIPKKHEEKRTETDKKETGEKDSIRGGDIFRDLIEARKASEARLKQQEEEYASLLAIGNISGTADDLARQILCRRLVAQGGTEKLQAALKLLDEQEDALKKRLGLPPKAEKNKAAAVPPPKTPDVKESGFPVPQQTGFQSENPPQKPASARGSIHELIASAESYFRLYHGEPGHEIRMQHIRQYFRDPVRLNEFLAIHDPQSWARQFKYLYDNIIIPASCHDETESAGLDALYAGEDEKAPVSTEALIRRNMDRMGL